MHGGCKSTQTIQKVSLCVLDAASSGLLFFLSHTHTLMFLFFVSLLTLSPGKKKMSLYDSQAPVCPICQVLLRPGELQEHMETEIERLAAICLR